MRKLCCRRDCHSCSLLKEKQQHFHSGVLVRGVACGGGALLLASGAAVFREGQRRGGLCSAALCVGVGRGSWASSSRVARLRAARSVLCSGQCLGRWALGRRGWRWGSRWRRGDSALFFGTGCRDGFLVLALRWARTLSGGRGRALVLALVALSGSAAVSLPRQGWNK